jgi:hypothetical protein
MKEHVLNIWKAYGGDVAYENNGKPNAFYVVNTDDLSVGDLVTYTSTNAARDKRYGIVVHKCTPVFSENYHIAIYVTKEEYAAMLNYHFIFR